MQNERVIGRWLQRIQVRSSQTTSLGEATLRQQQEALMHLAKCSQSRSCDLDRVFRQMTETSAKTLGVERVSVWFYEDQRYKIRCVDLYELSKAKHSYGLELMQADYPTYFAALEVSRSIIADDAWYDPSTREFLNDYLKPLGITSMLDTPIHRDGKIIGVVCHEHIGPKRHWSHDEVFFAGSIADLIAFAMEAADRRSVEEALRQSEANFRALADNADDGIVIADAEGRYVYANSSMTQLIGYSVDELLHLRVVDLVPMEERQLLLERFTRRISGEEIVRQYETTLLRKDGGCVPVEVAAAKTSWQSKSAVMAIFRDITGRKQAEQQLRDAHDDLEGRVKASSVKLRNAHEQLVHAEKLSAVGQLSASIAHEFNNPIFGIRSVLERVREKEKLGSASKNLVEIAIRECGRVSELMKKLQDFYRPSSGISAPMDVHEAINDVLILSEQRLKSRRILIETNFAQGLPRVDGIADQLKQVILNLLNNASEAISAPPGWIRIGTTVNENQVIVRIQDSGCGIPRENLSMIFNPFFTTKSSGKGTGLGLSVSQEIIKRHHGTIQVESRPSVGTTFTINLPVKEARQ